MCRCPLAKNLWRAMASDWPLPEIDDVRSTGPEWLFTLLEPLSDNIRMVALMTMWRVWYVRNKLTHGKPAPRRKHRVVSYMGIYKLALVHSPASIAEY